MTELVPLKNRAETPIFYLEKKNTARGCRPWVCVSVYVGEGGLHPPFTGNYIGFLYTGAFFLVEKWLRPKKFEGERARC